MSKRQTHLNRANFLRWMKRHNPKLYRTIADHVDYTSRNMPFYIGSISVDEFMELKTDPALEGLGTALPVRPGTATAWKGVPFLPLQPTPAQSSPSIWNTIADVAKKTIPMLAQTHMQSKIMKMQLKRAEKGLPPIDTAALAPTIRVQAGLEPETRGEFLGKAKGMLQEFMWPIIIGGGALLAVTVLRKK